MVTLSQEDVKSLFSYLDEQQTKFSLPIMNFINGKIAEQKALEEQNEKAHQAFEDATLHSIAPAEKNVNDIEVSASETVSYNDPTDD